MSDIHQEWKELREKNGNFINHLDGEMAKIEKKQVELKRHEQMQDLTDAGAFAMQFIVPPPFNCCQNDRDILKGLNKAQADRIKYLEDQIAAYKEQLQVDLAVKKELDEKLVERLSKTRERLANANESSKGMQSKIAKQANEIRRLTEENETLHKALDIAAKDADANFERGKIKGMKEIWDELRACYDGRPIGENQKIFGYNTVGDMLLNLSPTWFMNKAEEYHKQKEQQTKDIQIGDEVEILDTLFPDLHGDIGIVVIVDSKRHSYVVVGPNFEGCFDETDIQFGNVKKTGRHFDSIPLDYFA